MDRKAVAKQTMAIMEKGYYEIEGHKIEIAALQKRSMEESFLLTPEQGTVILNKYESAGENNVVMRKSYTAVTWNCSTVDAILKLTAEGKKGMGGLNFASAKNPGGGFLNGAMAQEESIAASSCLYKTLLLHKDYYVKNRDCKTMMYTDHAIYSPEVVFFRDKRFQLLKEPVTASVLTLPAVNMGQVMLKGEDVEYAEQVMKRRMKLSLGIFAEQGCGHLVLGAYGCGVFRNDPEKVAKWWRELLDHTFRDVFETIVFAVLDTSSSQASINAFEKVWGEEEGAVE